MDSDSVKLGRITVIGSYLLTEFHCWRLRIRIKGQACLGAVQPRDGNCMKMLELGTVVVSTSC